MRRLKYEVIESPEFPGQWHAEAIDDEGRVFVAVFSGPEAEERAREYADWKNGLMRAPVIQLAKKS